jgi:RimJ/RimL family protein N-acetyltransferase
VGGGSLAVPEASKYRAVELLRNGRSVEIRSLRPNDQAGLIAAVGRTSPQSLFRRFFAAKREFSEQEIAYFLNIDFIHHVALVAVVEEDEESDIIGGGRYILVEPGKAEVAFAVVDEHQGQGIGTALMRHLATIARDAGLKDLIAEVLPENAAMLKVFERSGLRLELERDPRIVHVRLHLD